LLKIWCKQCILPNFYVEVPVARVSSLGLNFFTHFVCLGFFKVNFRVFLHNRVATLVESRLSLSLVESRLSHRLELLFNLCENKVKTMWNPTFYYLVKLDVAKQDIFLCEAKNNNSESVDDNEQCSSNVKEAPNLKRTKCNSIAKVRKLDDIYFRCGFFLPDDQILNVAAAF